MTYKAIAEMSMNADLRARVIAAVAKEPGVASSSSQTNPQVWTDQHWWKIIVAPGWDTAWASADAANNPRPGWDETVITDGMILSQIQTLGV